MSRLKELRKYVDAELNKLGKEKEQARYDKLRAVFGLD